jgi:hypothetical protein
MEYFCDNPECIAHLMVENKYHSLRLLMPTQSNYKELHNRDYITKMEDILLFVQFV